MFISTQSLLILAMILELVISLLIALIINMLRGVNRKAIVLADVLTLFGIIALVTTIIFFYVNHHLVFLKENVEFVIVSAIFSLLIGSSIYSASYLGQYRGEGALKELSYFFLVFSIALSLTALSLYLIEYFEMLKLEVLRPILFLPLAFLSFLIGTIFYLMAKSREVIGGLEKVNEFGIYKSEDTILIDIDGFKAEIPYDAFFTTSELEYGAMKFFVTCPNRKATYEITAGDFKIKGNFGSLFLIAGSDIIQQLLSVPYKKATYKILNECDFDISAFNNEIKLLETAVQTVEEKKVISLPLLKIEKTSYYERIKMPFMEIIKAPGTVKINMPLLEVKNTKEDWALIALRDTIKGIVKIIIKEESIIYQDKEIKVVISGRKTIVKGKGKEIVYSNGMKTLKFRNINIVVRKDLAKILKGHRMLVALPMEGKVYIIDEIAGRRDILEDRDLAVKVRDKLEEIINNTLQSLLRSEEHSFLDEGRWFDSFF